MITTKTHLIYLGMSALLVAGNLGCTQAQTQDEDAEPKKKQDRAIKATKAPDAKVAAKLAAIGQWDGVTATATLERPYEDRLQQEIPFGQRSYYLAPWRAYMDTWPASKFLDVAGVAWGGVAAPEAQATAQVLAEAGVTSTRFEMAWSNFDYDDPTKLRPEPQARYMAFLGALKKAGIRPMILLNGNHGRPTPAKDGRVQLLRAAAAGAREIFVDDVSAVKIGYTGLVKQQKTANAFPVIVAKDAATGRLTLSAPLLKPLEKGNLPLLTLKYQPFAGAVFADGTPNPAAQESLDGWMLYVKAVADAATRGLGTAGQQDLGFDLEVWNEYSFGSDFLRPEKYYEPDRKFKTPISYEAHGLKREGPEIILPMTVDYAARNLPGVGVISGFSNQRPVDSGGKLWPKQMGISRHPYTNIALDNWDGKDGLLSPQTETDRDILRLNALGQPDGKATRNNKVEPGSFFIPTLRISMPEARQLGFKTEFLTRDIQPFPGPWEGHGRYANPGNGQTAQMWMTEYNLGRRRWSDALMAETGVDKNDERLVKLMHHTGAKGLLRALVFHGHKGFQTVEMFSANFHGDDSDTQLGVIPEKFFETLKAENYKLTPKVRAEMGPQLTSLKRVTDLMKTGAPIAEARPLSVEKLVEQQPRLVFAGDGTPAHPNVYHRDDFAVLPFQLGAGRFAVGYYVMTRDMIHVWNKDKDVLDGARYDMPDQNFDITLGNVRGTGVTVEVFDPLTGATLPAQILAATASTLTVRVPSADYPRFLKIDEAQVGPLTENVNLASGANGAVQLSFATNVASAPRVSWGALPARDGDGTQTLPVGTRHSLTIPQLKTGAGVQIVVEHDGLSARWPRWGHDVKGVIWSDKVSAQGDNSEATTRRVPPLPNGTQPSAFSTTLLGNLKWKDENGRQVLSFGKEGAKLRASLYRVQPAPAEIWGLLPDLTDEDSFDIETTTWGGVAAWRATIRLSEAAHPGEKDLYQQFLIAPLREGVAVLSFKGDAGGDKGNLIGINRMKNSVKFE